MTTQPTPQAPVPQWQPTNPPAPVPPEKQRSWFARHKVLTAILALLAFFALGSMLGGGDDAATPSEAASSPAVELTSAPADAEAASEQPAQETPEAPAEEPADDLPGIGDAVRDGKFEFVVTGVEDGGTEVGDDFLRETAQGRFHLIHVTVTNIGDEAQSMFDSNQRVRDEQGRTFEANSMAGIHLDGNDLWINEINPGNSVKGTLVFDMPEGAIPVAIELHDSMFSGGVTVSLQ